MSIGLRNQLRRVSNAMQSTRAVMLSKDLKRMSSLIKMTIPVSSDFIEMRNMVIENLNNNNSSSITDGNDSNDGSANDAINEVETICNHFVKSFFGYRMGLSDRDKAEFDSNWAFLLHSSNDVSLSSVVPSDDDARLDAIVHIISSEILLTHQGSAKSLGLDFYYYHCHPF